MTSSRSIARVLLALLALLALGCAGNKSAPATRAPTTLAIPAAGPGQLARFAGIRVMVLPAQGTLGADSLGWRAQAGTDRDFLTALDVAIEGALGDRGLKSQWVFPPAMDRAAKRNPTYVTDPYSMRALDAVRAAMRKPQDPLGEPFASQLRTLAGVSDVRYAFAPFDLRIEAIPGSANGRAVLRAAVFDARGSQLIWTGELAGDGHPHYSPAALGSLAQRVADLVIPR